MPVPESSYSRLYGREGSYSSSYTRSTSSTGLGRSSYLSSYSKSSSSLPPRPPAYEIRKYTGDTSVGVGSRFLSSSASRARDYGSSSYRSSVSPVRASASSIRRQLEASAPSIAERIKAMEIGESDDASNAAATTTSRVSRYSTLRSRDSPLNAPKSTYTSSYSRDRSGSKEYGSSPLSGSSVLNRGDSTKSSTENLRSRASPSGSTSAPLSRSGSGGGMRNGISSRVGSTEVNPTSSESATSASNKSVTVATTTTTTKPLASVTATIDDNVDDENKCAKDIENNDSDSLGSSCSASSSVSVNYSETGVNGLSSINMNGNDDKRFHPSVQVTTGKDTKMANDRKSMKSVTTIGGTMGSTVVDISTSSPSTPVVVDKDSNGNPISMETSKAKKDKQIDIVLSDTSKKSSYGSSSQVSPTGAKNSSRIVKKCESDSNANNILQETLSSPAAAGIVTCNGEASPREKSPYEAVLNYKPKSSVKTSSPPPSGIRKLSQTPKVIFHTIQVEEPKTKEVSPEPVSYTITSRPSLDGTEPKIEIKISPTETVSAEFKVTLPKLKSSTAISSSSESVHNNKSSASSEDDVEQSKNAGESMSRKVRESSPSVPSANIKKITVNKERRSPTPETIKKEATSASSSSSRHSSREPTPTPVRVAAACKSKSPSPVLAKRISPEKSTSVSVTNGEVENINASDSMGPHSSKYAYTSTSPPRDLSSNRNERERERPGRYAHLKGTQASDSSDNDSDAYSSSPQLGGRFRTRDGFEKAGLTGLRNIGNTCFMNTVLQCLSNTKPLLEYVIKDNYEADVNRSTSGMKGALIRAFGELIHELWREQRVVDTSAFKDQIQRFAPRFMGYSQQDAQEFLRYLLEGMHEDVNRVTSKPTPILTDIDDSLGDNEKAAESWKRYLRYESSKIVDMFVGQFKSTLKCTVCGHCSVTFDPFWDLSLPIPSRASNTKLLQCFELFAKEEVLDGDEKPTCAKCQCRRKCTKSLAIQKFPKILVVHLKRFSLAERYRGKLSTLVDYPLNGLDLTPFAATRGQGCLYNLYGVANHSGSTYSGHYIAYCKHPYNGEWHCYNDSRVSPISPHSVVSSEGYVLFYEQAGQSSSL